MSGEVIGLWWGAYHWCFGKMQMLSNCLLIFMFIPAITALVRETSLCTVWWLRQRLLTAQRAGNNWVLSPKWDVCITSSEAQGTACKGVCRGWINWRIGKSLVTGGLLDVTRHSCIHCSWACQQSIVVGQQDCEALPLPEKLLVINNCWEMGNHFLQ